MSAAPPKRLFPPLAVPTPLSLRTAQQHSNKWQNQRLHQPLINTSNTLPTASATLLTTTNDTKQTATIENNTNTKHISKVGWVWSSGWTKSWIGLLLLTVTDVSTTFTVVILRVKVSCITSVDGVILWLLIWLVNYVVMLLVVCQLSLDAIGNED